MKNKRKKIVILIIFILIALLLLLGFVYKKDTKIELNGLEIVYENGETITIENIKENFIYEKEIVVTNKSDELKTYSLNWIKVNNNFKNQNKFLYEIEGEGDLSATLDKSQIPPVSSAIFNSVAIKPKQTHTYNIKIWYEGEILSEKSSTFSGKFQIK